MDDYDTDRNMDSFMHDNMFMFLPLKRIFEICPKRNIYCEIQEIDENNANQEGDRKENTLYVKSSDVKIYHICLFQYTPMFSYTESSIKQIRDFVEECVATYGIHKIKKDKISKIYEYVGTYQDEEETLKLTFKEYANENQQIDLKNVISPHTDTLMEALRPFVYNAFDTTEREQLQLKYKHFMKNFKMNIMLYGEPGTGKTHMVKAICQYLNRTIVKVNLSRMKKSEELKELIHTRMLNKDNYSTDQIVFVIEECDADSNKILVKRNKNDSSSGKGKKKNDPTEAVSDKEGGDSLLKDILIQSMEREEHPANDALDLKTILDTFDGIRELNGSVILFTTNHIENLDPAFMREGRMDLVLEFKKCTTVEIRQLMAHNFNLSESGAEYERLNELNSFSDHLLSVSSIQNICFRYSCYDACMTEIQRRLLMEQHVMEIQRHILSFYPNVPPQVWDIFDVFRKHVNPISFEMEQMKKQIEECHAQKETWNHCIQVVADRNHSYKTQSRIEK
jgi:chaperone BCS1